MRYGIVVLALLAACNRPEPEQFRMPEMAPPASNASVKQGEIPSGPFALGRKPTGAELAAWSINVNPQGTNLPRGRGTAREGKAVYAAKCASCHGKDGEGTPPLYPKLVDREPKDFRVFDTDFKVAHTVGNYWPYATTLYDYIRRTMPLTAPGSLEPDETYAVIAYLLNANGIIAENEVIDAKSLPKVKMPAAGHFVSDNREGGPGFR